MQCLSKLVQILISLRPTVNIESGPTLCLLDLVTEAGMFDLKKMSQLKTIELSYLEVLLFSFFTSWHEN